jgi:DNA-binding transcriptional ArsR family regulator
MATAIGNPWRCRILGALALKDMSPSGFVREYGGEISNISRHFRQLASWGYLDVVERKSGGSRRGGVEHVYRTVRRAHLDTPSWEGLPKLLREDMSNTVLTDFLGQVNAAIDAGTFDADADRHLSWMSLTLDPQAFAELGTWFDEILARLPALEEGAKQRLAESGEQPVEATAALISFRSPDKPDS